MKTLTGKAARTVADAIMQRIQHGICRSGENLGTEQELAASFHVSRTTIRNATAFLMEASWIRRGQGCGFEVAGIPDTAPEDAPPAKLLLIRAADIPLDNEVFEGVMNSPLASHFDITMLDGTGEHGNYAEILNTLPDDFRQVLLFPLDIREVRDSIIAAIERGIKMIQLDRYVDGIAAPAVMFDNYAGACLATRHLLTEHGLPVYYFGNYLAPTSAAKRFEGWCNTMEEFGFDEPERYLVGKVPLEDSDFKLNSYAEILEIFLKEHPEPFSMLAVNDVLARRVYKCCEHFQRTPGADVFLVGFDDLALCRRLTPTLSSVATDRRKLGEEALNLLLAGPSSPGWRKLLPVQLKIRQSSTARSDMSTGTNEELPVFGERPVLN